MELINRLKALVADAPLDEKLLPTEEATKQALVLPFIRELGYAIFNPVEVRPEFTADVGTKKGEKVDYAIMRNDTPIILIECKKYGTPLEAAVNSQLFRYFATTAARFGIVTNGIEYRVFSDLDHPNKMDEKPFLQFSLQALTQRDVDVIQLFSKTSFEEIRVVTVAQDLKYTNGIKQVLEQEASSPSEELTKVLAKRVFDGNVTKSVLEQFTDITKRAFEGFLNDRANRIFDSAKMSLEPKTVTATPSKREVKRRNRVQPTKLHLAGVEYPVKKWNAVLVKTFQVLAGASPNAAELLKADCGRYCSDSSKGFKKGFKIAEGLWVETNLSSSNITRLCEEGVRAVGWDASQWRVETPETQQPL